MKKFTQFDDEKTGHRDVDGNWIDETAMAKCQTHMVLLETTEKAEA